MHLMPCLFLLIAASSSGLAQNLIPTPKDTTILESGNYQGASISYKQAGICETTVGVNSYSGYVTLPDTDSGAYSTSLFFWYFESRSNTGNAPLSIYIGGGPGTSSLDDMSGFPCHINPDSNGTTLNEWSWNTNVNMLYIDQPAPAGFSYVMPVDGVVNLLDPSQTFTPLENAESIETNLTMLRATMSGQKPDQTVRTSAQAARVLWDFAQVWLQDFPEYDTTNDEVSLWTVSYGGTYGPTTLAHFERQNERIANGTIDDPNARPIKLGTLGITNGCIDPLIQGESYPEFPFRNTYGIEAISEDIYHEALNNFTKPGGCADLIQACRAVAAEGDPQGMGTNETVNEICVGAIGYCFQFVQGAYTEVSGRHAFDITQLLPASFPIEYGIAFYNQPWVQEALGVPVNFTLTADSVRRIFFEVTGDPVRASVADLEYILSRGVNVAMVYGDRDYRCNWLGVEKVSLEMQYPEAESFRSAGYAAIVTNDTYNGGLVRQHNNVSFSRVFQAGHGVTAYQPETVFRIFERSMFGKDVATGEVTVGSQGNYSSDGPESILDVKNEVPDSPAPICLLFDAFVSCTPNQIEALADGSAVVKDFVVVEPSAVLGDVVAGGGGGDSRKPGGENGGGRGMKSPVLGWVLSAIIVGIIPTLR